MKKIFHSFLIFGTVSALIFSSGCKKAASIDGHVLTRTQATTPSGGQTTSTTVTYSYDDQGRQQLATSSNGNSTVTTYSSGSVTQITTGPNAATVTYQLNSQGLASSDNSQTTYTYDNNGYLTTATQGTANSTDYTITNGNVSSAVVTATGTQTTTYTYVYGTTQDYRNFGISFLGKRGVDLPVSESGAQGTASAQWVYTYTYDSKGRVIQETVVGNGETDVYSFTYTTN